MTFTVGALSLGAVARLVVRFGAKPVLVAGLSTLTVALGLFATVQADTPYFPLIFLIFVIMGLGAGTSFMPLLTIAMADVPPRDAGLASGIVNVSMQVSAALGLAVLGALAAQRTATLRADGHARIPAELSGYHLAFVIGAAAVVVGLLVTLLTLRTPHPTPLHERNGELEPEPQPA